MIYDCIIVGCGVSGSIAAYMLSLHGFSVLALEKKTKYDEKVCGGWVSHRAVKQLRQINIDVDELLSLGAASIKRGKIFHNNICESFDYIPDQYSIGTSRNILDTFLSNYATKAGAELIFGENVKKIEEKDKIYNVNGYYSKKVILSIGARRFDNRTTLSSTPAFGISEIVSGQSKIDTNTFCFFYDKGILLPEKNRNDLNYFWMIPIGNDFWNIGMGFLTTCKNMLNQYEYCKKKYALNYFENMNTIIKPRGSVLGTVDFSNNNSSYYTAGDFRGTCNPETGEGILNAIVSGMDVAIEIENELKNG